jgi:hypothetical protein
MVVKYEMQGKIEMRNEINRAFFELQQESAIGQSYVQRKTYQYFSVVAHVAELCPRRAQLLCIGSALRS